MIKKYQILLFKKNKLIINNAPFELIIWISGLLFLFITSFYPVEQNFCISKLVGLGECPGCGLGKSIQFLFKMDIVNSFNQHPVGIIAVIVLIHRIITLSISLFHKERKYYGKHL